MVFNEFMNSSRTVMDKDKDKDKDKVKRFVKPTIEEIKAYCDERKNSIDPQQFLNFYDSKDWMELPAIAHLS